MAIFIRFRLAYSHTVACYSNGSMADYWGGMPFRVCVCLCICVCVCVCICSVSPPTVFMVGQPFFVCKTCIPRSSSGDKLECKIYFILKVDLAGGSLRSHWSIQSLQQLSQVASPGLLAALWEAIGPSNHCSSCHRWPVMYCIIEQPIGINNTCSFWLSMAPVAISSSPPTLFMVGQPYGSCSLF